jgi:hypothetical protein
VDDNNLRLAISREFGSVNSGYVDGLAYAGYGCRLFNEGGGKHPRFTFGPSDRVGAVSGPDLVNRSRVLLTLPAPETREITAAPGVMRDAKVRTHAAPVRATPTDPSREPPAEQLALI